MAAESTSRARPPPLSPIMEEHDPTATTLPQPSETITRVKQVPQDLPITNNPSTESSEDPEEEEEEEEEDDDDYEEQEQEKQPHFSNSVSKLRNLSAALSAFQRRYDELQEHLDFIQTTINAAKLPQHLITDHLSLPQPSDIVPSTKNLSTATAETTTAELAIDKSCTSEIESFCKRMYSRGLRQYIVSHLSDFHKLRKEVPAALKLARNPGKLVLECFGRFFLQGSKAYTKNSPMILARRASVLILEFFLLMGCNDDEIQADVKEEAALAAVAWRKRLMNEGGLAQAAEIDARGLLLFIGCFGIPNVFTNADIRDLIRGSNERKITDAVRRSSFLLARIPDMIEGMKKNKMEVKAVDIAYIFGVESRFPPQTILLSFLQESKETWKRARKAAQGLYVAVNRANKKELVDLNSVRKCLKDRNIPLEVLSGWKINEKISSLEREIADLDKKIGEQGTAKRKADESESSNKLIRQEVKRTRFADHVPQQNKPATAYVDVRSPSDGFMPINLLDGGIPGHISSFSASTSRPHGAGAGPMPGIGGGILAAGVGAGMSAGTGDVLPTGSYAGVHGGMLVDRVGQVINSNGQPYGWHGDAAFRERLIGHSYAEPAARGVNGLFRPALLLEGFVGMPYPSSIGVSKRSSASDLYQFADAVVESETHCRSQTGGPVPSVVPAYHSSDS